MSVKKELLEGSKVKLSFTVEASKFDAAIDKAFDKKIKDVEIPGFRKGHVSKEMYLKKFGVESLYGDALDTVINDEYIAYAMAKKLDVVGKPSVDVDWSTVKQGGKVKFAIVVEVYPTVELGQYKGIEVEKEAVKVSAKDVNEYVNRILKQHSSLEAKEEGALEKGDTAVFDFCGSVDGVEFEGGKAENYSLEIGSGQFIPGFEDQMVGMGIDEEKDLNVKFPKEYQAANLAGKDAVFKVKLHEIKKQVVPTLTDEFVAEELEIENVKTAKEYKAFVKEVILKEKQEASDNKFADDIITKVLDNAKVDIPECMIEDEVNRQVSRVEQQAKAYNLTTDMLLKYMGMESLEVYKENLKPSALINVKQRIVLEEIAKVEKIKVTAADYNKEVKEIAKEVKKSEEEVKQIYTKEAITPYIQLQKALDLVKSSAIDTKAEKADK